MTLITLGWTKAEGHCMVERRARERRWRDAAFFLYERRTGDWWKYGSIALLVLLMANLGWLVLY